MQNRTDPGEAIRSFIAFIRATETVERIETTDSRVTLDHPQQLSTALFLLPAGWCAEPAIGRAAPSPVSSSLSSIDSFNCGQ
jgi:hypothetical protein